MDNRKKIYMFIIICFAVALALIFIDKNKLIYLQTTFYIVSLTTSISNLCILHL